MADWNRAYDANFKYDVAARPGGDQIKVCFSCGTCTAGCPVSEIDERFSPRRIIRQILLGQREAALSSELLWYCERCYACTAYCPQDVRFGDIMGALREMAVEEGYWPPEMIQRIRNVDRLAHSIRLDLVRSALSGKANSKDVPSESVIEIVEQKIKDASV